MRTSLKVAVEEERLEPGWPVQMVQYYKQQIAGDKTAEMKASIEKVAAERLAYRMQMSEEMADEEGKAALQAAQNADQGPSIAGAEARLNAAEEKQDAIDDEINAANGLLDADSRRDEGVQLQTESMKHEQTMEDQMRAALAEQDLRSKTRNRIPGAQAVDCTGLRIMTKSACEAEDNVIWKDEKCTVEGEDEGPTNPMEMKFTEEVNKTKGELEELEPEIHKAKASVAEHNKTLKDIEARLHATKHDKIGKTSAAKLKAVQDELEIAKKKRDDAAAEFKSHSDKDQDLRAKHVQQLEELRAIQQKEETDAENRVKADDKLIDADERQIRQLHNAEADIDDSEAKALGNRSKQLNKEAHLHEGREKQDIGVEGKATNTQKTAQQIEADDLRKGNVGAALDEQQFESRQYDKGRDAHLHTSRESAASGKTDVTNTEAIRGNNKQIRKDNEQIDAMQRSEARAAGHELSTIEGKVGVQDEYNQSAMRLQNTEYELDLERRHADRQATGYLSVQTVHGHSGLTCLLEPKKLRLASVAAEAVARVSGGDVLDAPSSRGQSPLLALMACSKRLALARFL